jgi:hypothetical protein
VTGRAMMAKLAPPAMLNEFFGLFAMSGTATSFVGPASIGALTIAFQSQRAGASRIADGRAPRPRDRFFGGTPASQLATVLRSANPQAPKYAPSEGTATVPGRFSSESRIDRLRRVGMIGRIQVV